MQQTLFPVGLGEDPNKEELTKLYKQKYKELGKILQEAKIPDETIRAVRELSIYYKHLNSVGDIDIDDIRIKAKEKNKGHGLRFFVRSKKNYDRLMKTYELKSTLSMNTALLIKNTYGDKDSDSLVQEIQDKDSRNTN